MEVIFALMVIIVRGMFWGFLTYLDASKNNPYASMGQFIAGAIFGLLACIVALVMPADTNTGVITSQQSTSHTPLPENKFENQDKNKKTVLSTDNWKCTCGKDNPSYVTIRTCGINKLDIISEDTFVSEFSKA